jgi:hypothetical protein
MKRVRGEGEAAVGLPMTTVAGPSRFTDRVGAVMVATGEDER